MTLLRYVIREVIKGRMSLGVAISLLKNENMPLRKDSPTPIAAPLTPRVSNAIEVIFPVKFQEEARTRLQKDCGWHIPLLHTRNPELLERIRLAAIKISDGTIAELDQAIQQAHIDWRDVLIAAGFGYDAEAHLHWRPSSRQQET